MRLSEAIRLGATMKPQRFDGFDLDDSSCALRAAADATGVRDVYSYSSGRNILNYGQLRRLYPVMCTEGRCPACDRTGDLGWISHHLNDNHRWTRERIADFVELHEPLPQPEATEPMVSVGTNTGD